MRTLTFLMLALLCCSSQILEAQTQADPAAAKTDLFREFESQKTTSPPLAYHFASQYLLLYGIDAVGLQVKKWAAAYEDTAPGIYSSHDEEFGLYSQNLNLRLHSALWAMRGKGSRLVWAIAPSSNDFLIIAERASHATYWSGVTSDAVKLNPSDAVKWNPSLSQNLAIWKDGDWQSFDGNGNAINFSSKRQDLVQALHRLPDGTLPSGLFANHDGGWIVTWGKNQFQCSADMPQELCARLADIRSKNQTIRQISFEDDNAWLILYGRNGAYWHGVPDDLGATWNTLVQQNKYIESASVFSGGGWYVKVRTTP